MPSRRAERLAQQRRRSRRRRPRARSLAMAALAAAAYRARAAKARARASSSSSAASRSSATRKPAATLASKGKRCSSRSQKAWMVWIFRPPGVSMVRANRRRAKASCAASGVAAPVSTISRASASSSKPVHSRERLEDARRHIGRRRLGEGQAEDARGRRAVEQQAQHALRQHMRLARAGVGRHPGRGARDRRRAAGRCRTGRGASRRGRAHASSPDVVIAQAAGRRPFLDAGEMVVVAEALGEFRIGPRQIGRFRRRRIGRAASRARRNAARRPRRSSRP